MVETVDFDKIRKFIDLIKDTDIEELVWEKDGLKIAFKRGEKIKESVNEATKLVSEGKNGAKKEVVNEKTKIQTIKSTLVGKFFISLPDRPPLVIEGEHVSVGQKIAVVETMKIFRDVISDKEGKIVKILVSNGSPVQYGQDIFLIDTEIEKPK